MPLDLGELLRKADHDVVTVAEEGLAGCDDPPVLQAATAEARILMTYDTDFADIRRYPPGTHAGIVVFRLKDNVGRRFKRRRSDSCRLVPCGSCAKR
jgi:predicted nuclease of predicted toxin-antitoxin system